MTTCKCGGTKQDWPACWAYQTKDGVVHTEKECGNLKWAHAPQQPMPLRTSTEHDELVEQIKEDPPWQDV